MDVFVGFSLIDIQYGLVGEVIEVDQSTDNPLFVVGEGKEEMLIPIAEEYIQDVDYENRIIQVKLPEGLLDL